MNEKDTSPGAENRSASAPFFSICIPQYNRTGLLIEALRCLEVQTFKSFEVCISEDNSTDGRQMEVVSYLQGSSLYYTYQPTGKSLRYDANTRRAMSLAVGRYCLLMGNDDCMRDKNTLFDLKNMIREAEFPGVLIGNFQDWQTGEVTRRIRATRTLPGSSWTAITNYRNMAFVSGLVVDRIAAQEIATEKWDGSEMYQMYILCRVIASGRSLLLTQDSLVRKDIRLPGEHADNYTLVEKIARCPIKVRKKPYCEIGRLISDSVQPYQKQESIFFEREIIFRQLYLFTYPFWIIEYRRIQSWKYSLGLCLGMSPHIVVGKVSLGWWRRARIYGLWIIVCFAGLFTPLAIFTGLREKLYSLSRSFASK